MEETVELRQGKAFLRAALVLLVVQFNAVGIADAAEKSVTIATLNWPPYTGETLPQGGATTTVVKAAFEKAGYTVNVVFRPWKRAIDMAFRGIEGTIAYYPGYHCKHRDGFVATQPIGSGPLGFAENVDAPIAWTSLNDISEQQLKIGTVLGYANTDEFDKRVGSGWIRAIPAKDDITNLKKLLRRRIDAAVIDKFVLAYLKVTEKSLINNAAKLSFNERPLANKKLYLCVRKGDAIVRAFNAGLKQVDITGLVSAYFATAFK